MDMAIDIQNIDYTLKGKYRMFDRVAILYILYLIDQGTQRKRQTKVSNYGQDLKKLFNF